MSSRADRKAAAREARLAAERADAESAARRRRLIVLGGVLIAAMLIVAIAVGLSQSGGDEKKGASTTTAQKTDAFAGIPQDGEWLGDPSAPVVMEEYADLQCPFCARYSTGVLPSLVDRYVKGGRARMRLRLIAILGQDSERAARFAVATGLQDREWQFTERFYANQGEENSGYVTDDFLREIASSVPGLDVDKAFADRDDPSVTRRLAENMSKGVDSTPSFFVGRRGEDLQPLQLSELSPAPFQEAFDAQLARGR